jgi:uncharacterized protein DUF5670
MGNLLYAAAIILFIGWLLGNFVFHYGAAVHVLLVIALVIVILKVLGGKKAL